MQDDTLIDKFLILMMAGACCGSSWYSYKCYREMQVAKKMKRDICNESPGIMSRIFGGNQ